MKNFNLSQLDATAVANYFLFLKKDEPDAESKNVTNLKLQKLLYYAQAWYVANYQTSLFRDAIEAWKYGPVIPNVYNNFKHYGDNVITSVNTIDRSLTEDQINDLNKFWSKYKKYSAIELVNSTHNEDPWLEAYNLEDSTITLEAMYNYYSKFVNE